MTKLRLLRNLAIATGAAVLLFAGTALSQEGRGSRQEDSWQPRHSQRQMRGFNRPSIREELGLTGEQEEKLQALHRDARKARIRSRADLQILRLDLAAMMRADNPDRGTITSQLKEMAALRTSQMMAHLDQRAAMREVLTPEQWEKMKTFRRRVGRRSMQRRMRHSPRRGGPRGMQGRPSHCGGQGSGLGGLDPWADSEAEAEDTLELDQDYLAADEPRL